MLRPVCANEITCLPNKSTAKGGDSQSGCHGTSGCCETIPKMLQHPVPVPERKWYILSLPGAECPKILRKSGIHSCSLPHSSLHPGHTSISRSTLFCTPTHTHTEADTEPHFSAKLMPRCSHAFGISRKGCQGIWLWSLA